jgi:penicillin-binding protein 2
LVNYLRNADADWYKQRVSRALFFVLAVFTVLFVRLFYLQVIEGEEFRQHSENNSIRLQSVDSPRGLILDRYGKLLVDNRPSFNLSIILKDAKPIGATIHKLAAYANLSEQDLLTKIERSKGVPSYKPVLLKQDVGRDVLAAIEVHKFDLPGVIVDVKPLRNYIEEQSAAHVLGYLGEINIDELNNEKFSENRAGDFIGKFGVEKAFEGFLRGKRGGRQVEVNATGQIVRVLNTVDAQPGYNLYLTIDYGLQRKAEMLLEGVAGAVAAMDPTNGHILALASSPTFNQNTFVTGISHEQWAFLKSDPFRPMQNKAVQGEYPPGSTYKIITAIAGLEEKIVDETTTIFCPGHYKFGNRVFRCWKRGGHGHVDIYKAIAESCDVFFYQVGQELGVDRLAYYAKACGLGFPTGIQLGHEAKGLIPTADWKKRRTGVSWQGGETLSVAIGQGYNLATPLQMALLTSAVANGGIRYNPLILKSIVTADGKGINYSKARVVGQLPAGEKTLQIVKRGLWEVVNAKKGTATIARLADIEICGKTGTSQVVGRKKDDSRRDEDRPYHLQPHAWFVAYAPADDPKIAVSVIVENGEHGSSTAAPIARELIQTYLSHPSGGQMLKAEGSDSVTESSSIN